MPGEVGILTARACRLCGMPDQTIALDPDLGRAEASISVGLDLWREVLRVHFKMYPANPCPAHEYIQPGCPDCGRVEETV